MQGKEFDEQIFATTKRLASDHMAAMDLTGKQTNSRSCKNLLLFKEVQNKDATSHS